MPLRLHLYVAALIIAALSLVVSNILIKDLTREETAKMEVWAEAMRSLTRADEDTDLNLVLRVLNGNNTIPVIVFGWTRARLSSTKYWDPPR